MSNVDLQALIEQKRELERKIAEAQKAARSEAIAKVKALMTEYGLTADDLAGKSSAPREKTTGKVAAKYRDPETGQSWTGRGLKPKWLVAALASGKTLEQLAVAAS